MENSQGKQVELVEDNDAEARAIQEDLGRLGCAVLRFADGQAALKHLLEHRPDLLTAP